MPEGPEIHRAANRIAKALVGNTLSEVEFHYKTVEGLEHFFLNKEDQLTGSFVLNSSGWLVCFTPVTSYFIFAIHRTA